MRLDDLDIGRCADCGKLFQREPGKRLCRTCAAVAEDAADGGGVRGVSDDFTRFTGMSLEQLNATLREIDRLKEAISPRAPACVRCKQRPALEDAEFCLRCQLDLYRSLGDAAQDLFTRLDALEEADGAAHGVLSAVEDKRDRAASARMRFVGDSRWKF